MYVLVQAQSTVQLAVQTTMNNTAARLYIIIIEASLSEPHIDHDNVPSRGECLYLCICSAQTVDLDHPWIVLRKL